MLCPIQNRENAEILLEYCARKLPAAAAAAFERHMEQCARCREFATGQKLAWEALDVWEAMPVPPDFDRRLYARIESRGQSGVLSWMKQAFWRPAAPVAAACVTLVAVFLLRPPGFEEPRPAPPRIEMVEVEQVERALDDMEMLRRLEPSIESRNL